MNTIKTFEGFVNEAKQKKIPNLDKLIGKTIEVPEVGEVKIKSVKERKGYSDPEMGTFNIDVWFDKPVIIGDVSHVYGIFEKGEANPAKQIGKILGVKVEGSEAGMQGDVSKSPKNHGNFDITVK